MEQRKPSPPVPRGAITAIDRGIERLIRNLRLDAQECFKWCIMFVHPSLSNGAFSCTPMDVSGRDEQRHADRQRITVEG